MTKFCALFILLLVVIGCQSSNKTLVKTSPTIDPILPTGKKYSSPEIGMHYGDFKVLCGETIDYSRLQTSSGEIVTYEYPYSDFRPGAAEKHCYGSFTFNNNVLTSIYQGSN